ncbi:MAG: hypothetical protein NVV59_18820 [Chitinophagaceae bacterium]|nr:hypothetical protein [Chitinophagaceae bacterium]
MKKLLLLLLLATTGWPLPAQNVVQLEYFFNADAGYGRNRVISATPSGLGEINFVPDLTGLSVGSHMLYTRVRDNNGQWSQTTRRQVEIYTIPSIAQVSQVEYAIDVDLGFGKNTIVNTTPGTNVSPAFTVSVAGIAAGRHILYTRVKDNTGRWSQTMRHSMEVYSVSPATTVVAVEYFFDIDPGYAKATRQEFTVPSTDGEFVLTIPQNQVPEGTHNLYVRVIGSNPRFSHTQFVTKNFQVNNCNIPAQPAVVANSSSCSGSTATYTIPAVAGADSYQWEVPQGVQITSGQGTNSITVQLPTVATSTNYTISVAAINACGAGLPRSINVTVNPNPVPAIQINASSTTICAGTNVTFTATATNAGANPSYQWRVNGTNVGTNSSTYSSTTLQNGNQVTCIVTSALACASPTTATSNAIAMTVSAAVTPTVSISSSSTTICAGTNVTFTATATNAGANPSYQWRVNGTNVGTNSSTYSSTTLQNGNQVTCVVTSAFACASPTTATSNAIAMTVSAAVTPTVSISASSTTICAGTNVTFTATATNAGANPSYQWRVNGTNVGTNSSTYSSTTLQNGNQVTCIVTSALACASPTTATSNAIAMTVSAAVTPTVSISASSSTICAGTNVTFTATATNAGANPSYQWRVNGTNVGSNSSTYTNSTLQDGDQVSCVLTSSATCVSNATVSSNTIAVRVSTGSTGSVLISGTTTVATGGLVILSSNVTGVTGQYTIQWQDSTAAHGWQNISGASNSTLNYAPAANGDRVRCVITSTSSCGVVVNSYSNPLVFTVVSTGRPSGGNIRCYPNPTNGMITVDSLNLDDQWSRLDMLDARGDMALHPRDINGQTSVQLNLDHLPGGFYLIRLWNRAGGRAVLKIVKY